MVKGRLL